MTAALENRAESKPVSAQLKLATRAVHDQLHRTPLLADFERGELGFAGYVRVMQVFHDFYASIDTPIETAMPVLAGSAGPFRYVARAPMFADDLLALGVAPHCPAVGEASWISLGNAATLAGVLYVIEGSILGGAGLNQCARKILQSNDLKGRFYWQWCRDNAASRWPWVRKAIDAIGHQHDCEAEMTAAAGKVFHDLLQRFDDAVSPNWQAAGAGR